MAFEISRYLEATIAKEASDLILTAGVPPAVRIHGVISQFDIDPLTHEDTQKLLYSVLNQEQVARFERELELDFSIQFQDKARFRGNAFRQKGSVAAVFRLISSTIPSLTELNLPAVLE